MQYQNTNDRQENTENSHEQTQGGHLKSKDTWKYNHKDPHIPLKTDIAEDPIKR